MNLLLNAQLAGTYKNKAQVARVLTEDWVLRHGYYRNCGNVSLRKFENNQPVADFHSILVRQFGAFSIRFWKDTL